LIRSDSTVLVNRLDQVMTRLEKFLNDFGSTLNRKACNSDSTNMTRAKNMARRACDSDSTNMTRARADRNALSKP